MNKRLIVAGGIIAVVVALASFMALRQINGGPGANKAGTTRSSFDIGITYLPLTRQIADYYQIDLSSGILVTEIASGSPADLAGIKKGDVIISCNGIKLTESSPLIHILNERTGNDIGMQIWRENKIENIVVIDSNLPGN